MSGSVSNSQTQLKLDEKHQSQIPALQHLIRLGYKYLSQSQVYKERGKKLNNVLLENILREQIKKINRIHYKGNIYRFTEENIQSAIQKLKNIRYRGLLKTNEDVYDLLTLGTSMEQSIEGSSKSFPLNYIDWADVSKNIFHVTAELPVERTRSTQMERSARPDIVLFVNGIPLVVIECKSPDIDVAEGISQMLRNQQEEYIPRLFIYAQLLLAVNKNHARYATVGTELKFWSRWKEQKSRNRKGRKSSEWEEKIKQLINKPLAEKEKKNLFSDEEFSDARQYFDDLEKKNRKITEQDRTLYSFCHPQRLLELMQFFVLYDNGEKKIARYQQFFVVHSALKRVKQISGDGIRKGGMIWHTQGSGKSLTMVWLARLLTEDEEIKNPRIIMVTDRKDLDRQIKKVFEKCGFKVAQATTGRQLVELIRSKTSMITTLVHKFDKALKSKSLKDEDPNIFVLVDESHRTQFGFLSGRMRQMLSKACYIGFTGTPLTKKEKNNFYRFGELIEPSYPMRQALEDKTILPLLYESRLVEIEQNKSTIDLWFERHTADLNEKQKADLKKKYSRANALHKAKRVVYMRAFDIHQNYCKHWKEKSLKAQLVAPDKETALKYHEFLKELGGVSSEVVISPPDMREGFEKVDSDSRSKVRRFWDKMMERFGSEKEYLEGIIDGFKYSEKPEILIVVDKLLTGFDAPVNAVLYICKPLREHTLLQAIARVNRIHKDKEFGYIVDYIGILGDIDKASNMYEALESFDPTDLEETLIPIIHQIKALSQKHSYLWDIFKEVKHSLDSEEYELLLYDDKRREEFYKAFSDYNKILKIALSSHKFLTDTNPKDLKKYKEDQKQFEKIRESVRLRYADDIDYKKYERNIKELLDTQVQADTVTQVHAPTEIYKIPKRQVFDEDMDDYENRTTKASQADRIAHLIKRICHKKLDEDPAYYEKFSKLIQKTINSFRQKRIDESEYLKQVSEIEKKFHNPHKGNMPEKLRDHEDAMTFFGVIRPILDRSDKSSKKYEDSSADIALKIEGVLRKNQKPYFWDDPDARNNAINDIEDYLYDEIKAQEGIDLSHEQIDEIIKSTMKIAHKRSYRRDYQ